MRFALTAIALLLSVPAQAGGLGVLFTGGAHNEKMWFHTNLVTNPETGESVELDDPNEFDKIETTQTLAHGGTGLELILGDRDDKILGTFRFYYMMDTPQKDPAEGAENEDGGKIPAANVIAAYRSEARHLGMGMVGLSWGIVGKPDGFQLGASGHVGSGFLTTDHTEFLAVDIGPMVTYKLTRQMQAFADLGFQARFRKGWSQGINGTAGVRYLFD